MCHFIDLDHLLLWVLVLMSPHGTLIWTSVLVPSSLDHSRVLPWMMLWPLGCSYWPKERWFPSLRASRQQLRMFSRVPLPGTSASCRWSTLIQEERVKDIIGLLNYEIRYRDLKHWGYVVTLICRLQGAAVTPRTDEWLWWKNSFLDTRHQEFVWVSGDLVRC